MKKTLLLCSHYPLPEKVGGNIRTMNFVRFFRKFGTVDLAYSSVLPGAEAYKGTFTGEFLLKRKTMSRGLIERAARWMAIRKQPFPIPEYDETSDKLLHSLIRSRRYDYILVRYLMNAFTLFSLPTQHRGRVMIDFDDLLSGSLYDSNSAFSDMNFLRKAGLKVNRRFLADFEKRCLGFGASLFCSEKDRAETAGLNADDRAFVVPNIYANQSFNSFDFGDGFANSHDLLFVGALMYKPNVDGVKWFINNVFRCFRRKYPDARLMVVGSSPLAEIRALCESTPGVELWENVPDLKEYYRRCRAVVVPLLAGGGTRLKILEAACAGRPVLSTPVGAEGLKLLSGEEILLFRDEHEFMDQYDMLQHRDFYGHLVRKAYQRVDGDYSVHNFDESMQRVLDSLEGVTAESPRNLGGVMMRGGS